MASNPDPPDGAGRSDKRAIILRAARELFLEHGFAVTSVDSVTRRSGVSKATVYAYFPHKETLLEAVVREEASHGLAVLDLEMIGEAEADLRKIAHLIVGVAVTPEVIAWDRMLSAEVKRSPALGKLFFDVGPGTILRLLADLFRRLNENGSLAISDEGEAAEFFFGLIVGVPILRSQLCGDIPENRPSADRVENAVGLFLRAYSTGGDRVKLKGKRSPKT